MVCDLYCNFFMPTCLFVTCSLDSRLSESLFVTACLTLNDSQELFVIDLVTEIRTAHQESGSMDNSIQIIVFLSKKCAKYIENMEFL